MSELWGRAGPKGSRACYRQLVTKVSSTPESFESDRYSDKNMSKYLVSRSVNDIISERTLEFLPFKSEPISEWIATTDLAEFLFELFNQPSVIIAPDGSEHKSNYSSHGEHLFEEGARSMTKLADQLANASLDVYHQDARKIPKQKHDFLNDACFGQAAKALIAWKGVDSAILSESAFVSIHHILEAGSDLDCSVELAKTHYYKQASYCLRAFTENVTLPLYFSHNPHHLALWKSDQFRVPRFRGKDGLLDQLSTQHLLSADLADQIGDIYGQLNASVHSSIEQMIHKGHDTGEWRGLSFKLDEFRAWSSLVSESVEAGIRMMKIQTDVWLKTLREDPDMCSICHSHSNYSVKPKSFAGHSLLEFTCKKCGHKWTRSAP